MFHSYGPTAAFLEFVGYQIAFENHSKTNKRKNKRNEWIATTNSHTRLINTFMWFQIIILLHALRHNCLIKCWVGGSKRIEKKTLPEPHKARDRERVRQKAKKNWIKSNKTDRTHKFYYLAIAIDFMFIAVFFISFGDIVSLYPSSINFFSLFTSLAAGLLLIFMYAYQFFLSQHYLRECSS